MRHSPPKLGKTDRLCNPALTFASVKKSLLLLLLALPACLSPEPPPADVLPPERMAAVLTDIHVAEAQANRSGLASPDSVRAYYEGLEKQVFTKYRVDTATYGRSYRWYQANPAELEKVYTAVIDSLTLRESLGRVK